MKMRRLLLLAPPLLAVSSGCATQPEIKEMVHWPAPAGFWKGLELVALERWDGIGPNRNMTAQFLELRCADQAGDLLMRRTYWPGPKWTGRVRWTANGVTYQDDTHNPGIHDLTFRAADIQQSLPCYAGRSLPHPPGSRHS